MLRLRLAVLVCFATVAIACSVSAQQPDSSEQALATIGKWFKSRLPKNGRFQLTLAQDWSHARSRTGDIRSVDALQRIRDVSLEGCEFRYTSELSLPGTDAPSFWKYVIPLGVIDTGSVRVQLYRLPMELRATTTAFEVYFQAPRTTDGFVVTDSDNVRSEVWENAIPIGRRKAADELAETLRHAARLCHGT